MFFEQPHAARFGPTLARELRDPAWDTVEAGVAWVLRSGTRQLEPGFTEFLRRGGRALLTVGIDMENTSYEGLRDFVRWKSHGNLEIYVYHNEASQTFHPKVYLFSNSRRARLFVGSNNITESGLYANVEAGVKIDAAVGNSTISAAKAALSRWRDTTSGLSKELTPSLLADLLSEGYVLSEQALLKRRRTATTRSAQHGRRRLFASVPPPRPPRTKASTGAGSGASSAGTVVLMRVRQASRVTRPTQIQVPKALIRSQFFAGVSAITSLHDGRRHDLGEAWARGALNTIKAEIPEIRTFSDPVLRLERTAAGITYEAYDGARSPGRPIKQALEEGFTLSPRQSFSTTNDRSTSTWWRFI